MSKFDCYAQKDGSYTEPINHRRVERYITCTLQAQHGGDHMSWDGLGNQISWTEAQAVAE